MIYLNIGFFKSSFILFSFISLPLAIACFVLTFIDFRWELLIVSLVIFLGYCAIVLGLYKKSRNQKYYLCVREGDIVEINYTNIQSTSEPLKLNRENIVKFEYYKITSVKAWCMLYNYVCPQCVYITYLNDGEELCRHIGYPKYEDIQQLCVALGITFETK